MQNILLIGCGNMGKAMLKGWVAAGEYNISIVDPNVTIASLQADGVGANDDKISIYDSADQLQEGSYDIIIIAIKPQLFDAVLPDYNNKLAAGGMVISIAAGVNISSIDKYFTQAAIVRVMPNLPAMIGKGMNGMVANDAVACVQKETVQKLIEVTGGYIWLDTEDEIDRLTAVSGSGPGYIFHVIEVYIAAAQKLGFSYDESKELVLSTIIGTAEMALESNKTAGELREAVTSKNGTTEAGLKHIMADDAMKDIFEAATQAAYARAKELGES